MEIYENKNKKTSARDLVSIEKKVDTTVPKKISTGKNDIIERTEQKILTEDGRELL